MLKVQFDGDVLGVRPEGPITREDVATLTRTADAYLAGHHFSTCRIEFSATERESNSSTPPSRPTVTFTHKRRPDGACTRCVGLLSGASEITTR